MNSKDYIVEALFQLLQKKDYEKITISEIAKKAGVNRITIYRNFDYKEDILFYYIEKIFDDYKQRIDHTQDVNNGYEFCKMLYENREKIGLIYKSKQENLIARKILLLCDYKEEDINVIAYTKSLIAYMFFGWINEWVKRGMLESPEEITKEFERLALEKAKL